ncbi:MAG: alpha/beta hydrolase, partial [Bacteroidetes bacterium QH_2_63_10]
AKVQVVDGAGHLLMLERPNRFRRAFRSFLND